MSGNASTLVNALIALVALAALVYIVYTYTGMRSTREGMNTSDNKGAGEQAGAALGSYGAPIPSDPTASDLRTVDYPSAPGSEPGTLPNDCFPKDRLVASDLLPKDASNEMWARVNPAGQGDVDDKNYLNSGYLAGINTIGGTLRNANQQIRSEPPNPRARVSVWNQSTIEPDLNRRPFEIDGGCS